MQLAELDLTRTYSYADYYQWDFDERVELFYGKIFPIGPSPGTLHQRLSSYLQGSLFIYLQGRSCQLYAAPFDVRFPFGSKGDEEINTVLQPDLCVVCDHDKLDDRGCLGVPDLIIEILSLHLTTKRN